MKICFFIDNISHTGGTERVSILVGNELAKRGHKIIFLSLWGSNKSNFELESTIECVTLYPNKVNFKKNYLSILYNLRKFIKKQQLDCFITVESMLSLFSVPATFGINVKLIVWEHFNFKTDLGQRLRNIARKLALKYADKIVVLTNRDVTFWNSESRVKDKVISIPNPLTYQVIGNNENRDSNNLLAVGRYTYQKGFDLLIKAFKLVHEDFPQWTLNIVGSGEDYKKLEDLILENDLKSSVFLIPSTPNVDKYFNSASVFCLSSRFEGLPMVLLEAQAFGLPSVAFDCVTGPSEIIIDNKNGFLVQDGSILDFAEKLKIVMGSKALRLEMSEAAKLNSKRFALEGIIDNWESLFISMEL